MIVPAELIERSYYTIIRGIKIYVSEKAEISLRLRYAIKCEKIRTDLKYNTLKLDIRALAIHIYTYLYLRINCACNSNNTMIYIVQAPIKEYIMQ